MSLPSQQQLLIEARLELQEHAWPTRAFVEFVRNHRLDQQAIGRFIGGYGVVDIVECGADRFDFAQPDSGFQSFEAFAFEALGEDGETVVDLVAVPLGEPAKSLTMFGRCGLVGLWEAMGPATYFMGAPLVLHRTVLEWLRADCVGAAIVTPGIAASQLVAAPGRLAAEDHAHGRELLALLKTVIDVNAKVVVRSALRRAA